MFTSVPCTVIDDVWTVTGSMHAYTCIHSYFLGLLHWLVYLVSHHTYTVCGPWSMNTPLSVYLRVFFFGCPYTWHVLPVWDQAHLQFTQYVVNTLYWPHTALSVYLVCYFLVPHTHVLCIVWDQAVQQEKKFRWDWCILYWNIFLHFSCDIILN